jgi:hypothetical protein
MTIQTDFEERFAGVVPPIVWQPWVESVWPSYACCMVYDDKNKEAILNLIAHLLLLDSMPGTGAARTEESKAVGSVSVSYGSSMSDDGLKAFFNSTKYGQRYWLLTGRQVGGRFV